MSESDAAPTFSIRRMVQFAETDMAGVMHFSNYFRLMEEVEHAWWRTLGLSVFMAEGPHKVSWPRVSVKCEYATPARFEDMLDLSVRVVGVGAKSLRMEFGFSRDGVQIARGEMTTVCCAMRDGRFRAVPIPDEIRAKLDGYLTPG